MPAARRTAVDLTLPLAAAMLGIGAAAGTLGALVGIGGGVLVVPSLVLLFGIDMRIAIATSLVAVVATSTAAGSVYVGSGTANMRLGMTLEIATTLGGIGGGILAARVPSAFLSGAFGVLLAITAVALLVRSSAEPVAGGAHAHGPRVPRGSEARGRLAGHYVDEHGKLAPYTAHRAPVGLAISFAAGVASGMLGVGGGFLKVPAMALGMRVPFKVAAATSNFMIGVTATSSLFIYFARGDVVPALAAPVALGVAAGALAGTTAAHRLHPRVLRWILAAVLALVAVEMGLRAFGVRLG